MGMFDHVEYKAPCPTCGNALRDWQSKDGPCLMMTLKTWQVNNFHTFCDKCQSFVEATVDAEVEHIVKKCEISLKARPAPTKGAVPEWIKKAANESKGKVLSLEEMRERLSKCSPLSEEVTRERHSDGMKYNAVCCACGSKIEVEAQSAGEAYKLLREHMAANHPDRKFDSEFPVWAETGAQVVFPVRKDNETTKTLNRLADEGVLAAGREWQPVERGKMNPKELLRLLDEWSKELPGPDDEEIQEIIKKLANKRSK